MKLRIGNIFSFVFLGVLLGYTVGFNQVLSAEVTEDHKATNNVYSQEDVVHQGSSSMSKTTDNDDETYLEQNATEQSVLPASKTTLHRNAVSSNTSELFAKVIDMEERIRELNGRLENAEFSNSKLTKQINTLNIKLATIATNNSKVNLKQKKTSCSKCSNPDSLKRSIGLVKIGKNAEAIKLLNDYLKKAKSKKIQLDNEGEVYYWLGKAYVNQKDANKAVSSFAKSYKFYSNVRLNDTLIGLIDALELDKKYDQICPLLNKLDAKYINTLSKTKQNKLKNLRATRCKKS